MQVTDLLAPLAARWGSRVREELDVVPHPFDSPRHVVAGPDPDRVLVLGNGPAVGFGVLTQDLALPGHLARLLAATTGRGATVDVLARRGTTAALAPRLIDDVRMSHYDAVLVCVGSSDAYNLLNEERWRADLAQLTDTLRAATTPSTVIAVLPIRPLQRPNAALGRAGRLVEGHAARLDRIADEVCARRAGVVHVGAAAVLAQAPRTSEAYAELAGLIAPVLVLELDRLAAKPAPVGARALRSQPDPEPERQSALDRTRLLATGSNPRLDRLLRSAQGALRHHRCRGDPRRRRPGRVQGRRRHVVRGRAAVDRAVRPDHPDGTAPSSSATSRASGSRRTAGGSTRGTRSSRRTATGSAPSASWTPRSTSR